MRDPITKLINRQHFLEVLEKQIDAAGKHHKAVALLIIDIRNFRRINRIYGHAIGDKMLQAAADILQQVKRDNDEVARTGDNQFSLMIDNIKNIGHAQLAAHKIQNLFDSPLQIESESMRCKVVIGLSIYPNHAIKADQLFIDAEEALQTAKQTGRAIATADENLKKSNSDIHNMELEVELENSISRSKLRVFFQPKISLATNKPIGAEALVRWESDSYGILPPNVFLPVAESIGFLKPLTEWMLKSAIRLSNEWTTKWGQLDVSVNIPTIILDRPDFTDLVLNCRNLWKPNKTTLCLEILEQSFIQDINNSFLRLNELRQEGIRISVDDFGTGYSSLAYFRDIPANQLKIDQSFVSGLLSDKANENIVGLIINLAHRFNLEVVAEGVENIDTLRVLKNMGCDVAQGYLYSKPIPAEEFQQWLNNYQGLPSCPGLESTG